MQAETIAAIAAVASAGIAIAAAVSAWRSASRSAEAEERSAGAAERSADAAVRSATLAEEAVAIERERLAHDRERVGHEQRDRAEREAPQLDAGEKYGNVWEHNGRQLEGLIHNVSSTTAIIEHLSLEAGGRHQDGTWDAADAVLAPNGYLTVAFVWDGQEAGSPVVVHARFKAAKSDYRATAQFSLRRRGADQSGHPLWVLAETRVVRL